MNQETDLMSNATDRGGQRIQACGGSFGQPSGRAKHAGRIQMKRSLVQPTPTCIPAYSDVNRVVRWQRKRARWHSSGAHNTSKLHYLARAIGGAVGRHEDSALVAHLAINYAGRATDP